jgi:amidohydrolase
MGFGREILSSICVVVLAFLTNRCAAQSSISPETLTAQIEQQIPELTVVYKHLHRHPELSHHEEKTSAYLAGELRKTGYEVTERVGAYPDGSKAWGIVGILKNGTGPTALIRTDMDALPVTEATGLDYASHERAQLADKQDVGVMHACGHDIHMTVLLGVARELAANKDKWHGTVVLVGQPSEETLDGAKAMLAADFYSRFPKPDYILDEHDTNKFAAGHIAVNSGPVTANSTSVKVVFHGISTHGAFPDRGKDPIVMGAEFVLLAQTIISRQISAQDPTILTVGTFNAGTKNNIIPEDAVLGLSLRSFSEETRVKLLDGVKRTANGVATAYGVALDRMPDVDVYESTPSTINDSALTERMHKVAVQTFGVSNVDVFTPVMGSEDVGHFSLEGKIPFMMFSLGAADPAKLTAAQKSGVPLPTMHSPLFAPVYEPTIHTGVAAMTAMALDLLQ